MTDHVNCFDDLMKLLQYNLVANICVSSVYHFKNEYHHFI